MSCVTSTSFSISINGDIHGYFKGGRGLWQGDPISPYLFTLVMEVWTLIIQRRVRASETFRYYKHCEEMQLINVCFADDLFNFARGEVEYARLIIESLSEFQRMSGLVPRIPKSMAYFYNVRNHVKHSIRSFMPFVEGEFSVKYLGVPLISSRLLNKDCKILVERVKNHIGDWKNESLSFAGRLQLCIIQDFQQHMCGFLWSNGELKHGKAKVAWENICLSKSEGSLGNGKSTSVWFDNWCSWSPLISRQLDSHAHLFFNAVVSKVGYFVRPSASMENVPSSCLILSADCFMVHVEVVVRFEEPRRELPLSVVLFFPTPRFCPLGFT
ncbi:putative reverse transcriptase domain, reverse transcriptase zinc-binding domain protein [Tanacetum coccineum]